VTLDDFWSLIDSIQTARIAPDSEDEAVQPLIENLSSHSDDDIFQFTEHLAQMLYDIDGKAYADATDMAGDSDDAFLYCRCFVVGSGRRHYESVKLDPAKMPTDTDAWFEALLYVGQNAWALKHDSDSDDFPHVTRLSYESGSNTALWR
jgi:hypothetical protein